MPRITLAEARAQIAMHDATFPPGANNAQKNAIINSVLERFIGEKQFRGTLHRLRIVGVKNVITLPWRYDRIEEVALDGVRQVGKRNQWFEFLGTGTGTVEGGGTGMDALQDHGEGFCTIFDPDYHFYVRIITELSGPAGTINLRGLDADGAEVYSTESGEKVRGLNITMPTSPGTVTTSQAFSKLESLVKPVTNGRVWIYAVNTGTAAAELLGIVSPGETVASWHRYIQSLTVTNDTPDARTYTVLAKLAHRVLQSDYDQVIPSMVSALVEGVRGLNYRSKGDSAKGSECFAEAFRLLNADLEQYMGSSFTGRVQMQMAGTRMTNLV